NAEKIKGGYVTVQLEGSVGAVKAAVEAATEAIQSLGTLISSHVIPRMHEETTQLIVRKKMEEPLHDLPNERKETNKKEEIRQEETSETFNSGIKENKEVNQERPVKKDEVKVKLESKKEQNQETASEKRKE